MTTNEHIKALGAELSLSPKQVALLQQMWSNRDVGGSILLSEAGASKDFSRRDFKVVIFYKGEFTDVTQLVAQVSDNKYKNGVVEYNGGNTSAAAELLFSFFTHLAPDGCDEKIIKMKAATEACIL